MSNRLQKILVGVAIAFSFTALNAALLPSPVHAQSYRESRSDGESRDRMRRDRGEGYRDWRSRGRDEERRGEERSSSSSNSSSSRSSSSNSSSTSSNDSKTPSTSTSSPSLSTAEFAKTFIREHDKDKNGWLNGDELKDLRGKPADADLNKDGILTVEELTARLSSDTPTTAPTSSTSSGSKSDSDRHDDRKKGDADLSKRVLYGTVYGASTSGKESDKRHTYRFSKAADHLPSGLPGWFKSKDANGDGQVSMSEYSRSWSKSTVSEFRKYDLNDDGIVTAKEAAKPESKGG